MSHKKTIANCTMILLLVLLLLPACSEKQAREATPWLPSPVIKTAIPQPTQNLAEDLESDQEKVSVSSTNPIDVELMSVNAFFDRHDNQLLETNLKFTIPPDMEIIGQNEPDFCFLSDLIFKRYVNGQWELLEVESVGGGGGGGTTDELAREINQSFLYQIVHKISTTQKVKLEITAQFCHYFEGYEPMIFEIELQPSDEKRDG